MKRIRRAGWALLIVASGALAGCHKNQHQGPHYSGWGGCYSHRETDHATGRLQPSCGLGQHCSHDECRADVVHGGAEGIPMVPSAEGGHPLWSQPANGAGLR